FRIARIDCREVGEQARVEAGTEERAEWRCRDAGNAAQWNGREKARRRGLRPERCREEKRGRKKIAARRSGFGIWDSGFALETIHVQRVPSNPEPRLPNPDCVSAYRSRVATPSLDLHPS